MDSGLQHPPPPPPHPHHHHQQQQQMNSGLTRYRSAPSSYFTGFLNSGGGVYGGEDFDHFLNPRATSPETERIFRRFISSGGREEHTNCQNMCDIGQNSSANETLQSQFVEPMKHEAEVRRRQQQQQQQNQNNCYSSGSQMIYQSQSQPTQDSVPSTSAMGNSYRVVSSMTTDHLPQMKTGGGNNSNLIRHSSSPAGLFSHINVENGYGVTRGRGDFGAGNGANAEASFSSASNFKGQMDFCSGSPSSSGLVTRISETGAKSMGLSSPKDGSFNESPRNDGGYITGFQIGSWDDSAIMSENFIKGLGDSDKKTFSNLNASENQNSEGGHLQGTVKVNFLSHHLSLPTSSAELSAMEKLLQFQDSVPCKIRAKRGCATHPRSIAERVRRTRISERMRKLQELVPNMDKQTNTSDMLDLAVDYIKDLQTQVKKLSDNRAKCKCSSKQNS